MIKTLQFKKDYMIYNNQINLKLNNNDRNHEIADYMFINNNYNKRILNYIDMDILS